MKFWDIVQNPSRFPMPLPVVYGMILSEDIIHESLSCRENKQMYKVMAQIFSGGTTPTFLQQIVSVIYCLPFGKLWFSSICSALCVKPNFVKF